MPGPITYAAVALLARDRLARIQARLTTKTRRRPPGADLERQLAYLARKASDHMTRAQPGVAPPLRLYGPPTGDQVSKFLFMGAVGPEFTAFAAPFAPLQRWLRDTLHKGTPDAHFEQALSYSTDFAIEFWRRVGPAIQRELPTPAQRDEALAQMQAYLLGHACHIATDVVCTPYVDALVTRLGTPDRPALGRNQVISAIEAEVLARMFNPSAPPTGHEVDGWWPEPALVPAPFFTAFREALEAVYGAGANREGGAPYEALRAQHAPPALSRELLEDGYRNFRQALGMGQSWSGGQWLLYAVWMFLPAIVALPLAAALPAGQHAFSDHPPVGLDSDAALFEAINLPFATGALVPLAYTFGLTLSPLGAEGPVIFGWVSAAAQVIGAVVYFATLGSGGVPKWLLLFALPLAIELAFIVYALTQVNADNPRRWLLVLAGLTHLGLGAVFALLYAAVGHKVPQALNAGDGTGFAVGLLLWTLLVGGLCAGTVLLMRYVAAPVPARPDATPLPSGLVALPGGATSAQLLQRSTVALTDETLMRFAGPLDDSSSPAARYFPSDRRPLLKLWWTGGGNPTVLARHDRLEFHFGATTRTVFAPAAPARLDELAAQLQAQVTDGGGQAALHAQLFFKDLASHELLLLPAGLAFGDGGDDQSTELLHDQNAPTARPLGSSEDTAFVLHSAPRRAMDVPMARDGPLTGAQARAPSLRAGGTFSSDPAPGDQVLKVAGADAPDLRAFFRVGDFIEAPFGDPLAPRRRITSVDSASQVTLAAPFPAALAAATCGRVAALAAPPAAAPATISAAAGATAVQVAGAARLQEFLRPGDQIEAPFGSDGAPRRTVVSVDSDTQITVATPFPGALAAGTAFGRISRPTDFETPPATWQVQTQGSRPPALQGINTQFGALFNVGDTIRVIQSTAPLVVQDRLVVAVVSDTLLHINRPLDGALGPQPASSPPPPAAAFQRLAREEQGLHPFLGSLDDTEQTGGALLNEAADMATLLCLGITSHLLPDAERDAAAVGSQTSLNRSYQVFRNWNLDRRRVNEWRMLVQGGAVSEKAGLPAGPDFALGALPAGFQSSAPEGEPVATRLGWLPLLRQWLDMAARGANDVAADTAARAGGPTNRELSRGLAFLLDQRPPA